MRVCGVIAEYDPFHKGHLFHLSRARELTGADFMVCVLGGAFSQRGEAMLFHTFDRARMALENGFDLAVGMPLSFSCAQANRFARGGVGILHQMSLVSHLSFGCETDRLDWLETAAGIMNRPDSGYVMKLREGLAAGQSFAKAQGKALSEAMPDLPESLISSPNFILGLSYLRELKRRDSLMIPIPVPRSGSYHSLDGGPLASASAVRSMLMKGDEEGAMAACPEPSGLIIRQALASGQIHPPDGLDRALIASLISDSRKALRRSPEIAEGLEQRIHQMARRAATRRELISLVKSKRYPYARISRALSHLLTGASDFPEIPEYARLLGFRKRAVPLLSALAKTGFPIIDRPARAGWPGLTDDMRAEELWALGAGKPPQSAWRQKVIVVD